MLGHRIKERRNAMGLTQKELAKKINISFQTVSKYELGVNTPDADMLIKLSNILECSTDFLLGKTDIPTVHSYSYNDKELGNIEVKVDDYPYKLTPEEVKEMIQTLKKYHFNVDAIIEDMRK